MAIVPGTSYLTEQQWADALVTSFSEFNPPRYEGNFNRWATQLLNVRPFSTKPLPRPELFPDWKQWARVVQGIMET